MTQNKYVMTLTGSLMLLLVSTACASKSQTRTAANQAARDSAAVSADQMAVQGRVATQPNERPVTERSVPSDRTGSGDDRMASDRVVPCADQKGDMTTSLDCGPQNRQ